LRIFVDKGARNRVVIPILFPAKSIDLGLERADDVRIAGDADALGALVANLVDNAIRYGHEGGTVRVRVYPEDGAVWLDVEDGGIGIPPAVDPAFTFDYRNGYTPVAQAVEA
jgi:signal transduction histidine kinase